MKLQKQRSDRKLFGFSYQFSDNLSAYYFLLVDNIKEIMLKRVLAEDKAFKVTDYGIIIASGYGAPSEEVKVLLRDKYNADI